MTISYVRSTFAQIPFVNTDKVRAVLQEYFYLPRPRFKAATKAGKLGSLEISGPGEFQCYGVDQDKLPYLNPDEIAVVGSDPGLDNFNWREWGVC